MYDDGVTNNIKPQCNAQIMLKMFQYKIPYIYNCVLLTDLEFNCMESDFLCLWYMLPIGFNVIRNCIQKFVLWEISISNNHHKKSS